MPACPASSCSSAASACPPNLTLAAQNPGYYTAPGPKLPTMDYVGYADGPLFIGGDGNHRSAIASCLLPLDHGIHRLTGIEIRRHRYDAAAALAFTELTAALARRRLPRHALASRRLLGREDGPGWSRETFQPLVTVFHPGGRTESLTPQRAAERAAELRRGTWLPPCARWLHRALARDRHRPEPDDAHDTTHPSATTATRTPSGTVRPVPVASEPFRCANISPVPPDPRSARLDPARAPSR